MSGGLAPSKSTIYVSNLPFSLTNNDLHKIFEKYGKVVKVTIMRDKVTRQSKGVAFILFLDRNTAYEAVRALNNTQMFGRTIKCHIAKDNGRTTEFIRRKEYKDKTRCYECGESGHLSYKCSKNLLGEREPPKKKEKKRKKHPDDESSEDEGASSDGNVKKEEDIDSLSAAINYQHQKMAQDWSSYSYQYPTEDDSHTKKKKYKKATYFSDEEELEDD